MGCRGNSPGWLWRGRWRKHLWAGVWEPVETPGGVQGKHLWAGAEGLGPLKLTGFLHFMLQKREIPHFLPFWRLTETTKMVWEKSTNTHTPHKCSQPSTHLDLASAQVLEQSLQRAEGGSLHEDASVRELDGLQRVLQASLGLFLSTHHQHTLQTPSTHAGHTLQAPLGLFLSTHAGHTL